MESKHFELVGKLKNAAIRRCEERIVAARRAPARPDGGMKPPPAVYGPTAFLRHRHGL